MCHVNCYSKYDFECRSRSLNKLDTLWRLRLIRIEFLNFFLVVSEQVYNCFVFIHIIVLYLLIVAFEILLSS